MRSLFHKQGLVTAGLIVLMSSFGVNAGFLSSGTASPNAYVFEDFSLQSGSIQGGVAVGGNAFLTNYFLGTHLKPGDSALSVHGNTTLVGGSIKGTVSSGGSLSVSNMAPLNMSSELHNIPGKDHFSAISQHFLSNSSGSSWMQWGRLLLDGPGVDTLVVSLSDSQWGNFWGLGAQSSSWKSVVINVPGEHVTVGYLDWLMKSADYSYQYQNTQILYNFYEAKTVTVSGALYGSVLAPNATVIGNHGVISGQLVSNAFKGSIELRDGAFNLSPLVELPTDVSAPSFVFILLLSGWIAMRRRALQSLLTFRFFQRLKPFYQLDVKMA